MKIHWSRIRKNTLVTITVIKSEKMHEIMKYTGILIDNTASYITMSVNGELFNIRKDAVIETVIPDENTPQGEIRIPETETMINIPISVKCMAKYQTEIPVPISEYEKICDDPVKLQAYIKENLKASKLPRQVSYAGHDALIKIIEP